MKWLYIALFVLFAVLILAPAWPTTDAKRQLAPVQMQGRAVYYATVTRIETRDDYVVAVTDAGAFKVSALLAPLLVVGESYHILIVNGWVQKLEKVELRTEILRLRDQINSEAVGETF